MPSPLRTLLGRGLLALALLFAQQTAALHWLSHAVDATHAKASKPAPSEHCDECLAIAGLGAGATSSAAPHALPDAQHVSAEAPAPGHSPAALRLGFHSRAPPILS